MTGQLGALAALRLRRGLVGVLHRDQLRLLLDPLPLQVRALLRLRADLLLHVDDRRLERPRVLVELGL